MNRFKAVKRASFVGIFGNIFLLLIKGTIGFLTHSQAMLADAFNSATDVLSSFMTYVGNQIASKEADEDHNLGHGKAEYIFSMLISITMFILGFVVLKNGIQSIFISSSYIFSKWLILVCLVTIGLKFFMFLYTNAIGKKYNNLLLKANSKDHRNDCVITLFNLLSAIFSFYHIHYVDSFVGIGISLWILYTGVKIFIESYDVLMDKTISQEIKNQVMDIIKCYEEIEQVKHFNATPVGYLYQISFTIYVDGNLSTFASHEIANSLEKEIDKEVEEIYLTIIHVNPVEKS